MLLEVLILAFFAAALAYGQFTSGVDLVEVYASVSDARGQPIEGLRASDFDVKEDGIPQAITAFAAGTVPLALAIAIDRSFSIGAERLATIKSAARALIDALVPGDLVAIVAIGSETETVAPLSADREAAVRAVDRLDVWGTTPLYDAAIAAIDAIQPAKGRRAIVLISDGADRGSETTAATLVDHARRRDVLVYPIAVGRARPPVFAELAAASGGRSFFATSTRELNDDVVEIARELRSQYLIGYVPGAAAPASRGPDSRWHAIDVSVKRPGARVRARDGYFGR